MSKRRRVKRLRRVGLLATFLAGAQMPETMIRIAS